jgi:hypothetical protein
MCASPFGEAGGSGKGQALRTNQTMIKMTMTTTTIPGITKVAPSILPPAVLWRADEVDARQDDGLIHWQDRGTSASPSGVRQALHLGKDS